ncbi:MAG: hypothetical protein PVJ80_13445 [Gemmatimonadota bacterium]|jgi:hypothetical protein
MEIVPIGTLWLPILVAGAIVFVVSSIIHMLLPYHRNDFWKVPGEDGVMEALRPFDVPPGDYVLPHAASPDAMRSEEFRAKVERGPTWFITVVTPSTFFNMVPQFVQWFVYTLLVGIVAAYLGGRMLGPGADYLEVFRVTGTVAFASYSMALMQSSIWYKQRWSTTLKSMFDGLIYAALTGGVFGWLWPI